MEHCGDGTESDKNVISALLSCNSGSREAYFPIGCFPRHQGHSILSSVVKLKQSLHFVKKVLDLYSITELTLYQSLWLFQNTKAPRHIDLTRILHWHHNWSVKPTNVLKIRARSSLISKEACFNVSSAEDKCARLSIYSFFH